MPDWFLNPALTRFRNEVNSRWPRRDKTSDGTIGDTAHQATDSDHNPDLDGSVDAWDMDVNGVDVAKVIAAALKHESIQYIIYNRRITSRSWGLGTWRPYTGTSPHTEHVHFNTRQSFENSNKPWFTEEEEMSFTKADAQLFVDTLLEHSITIKDREPVVVRDLLKQGLPAKEFANAALNKSIELAAVLETMPQAVVTALSEGPTANLALLLKENMPADKWLQFVSDISALDEES